MTGFKRVAARLVLTLGSLAMFSAAQGAVTYNVTVDTTGITGTSGNLNFQFNPGGGAQAASATVSGWNWGLGGSFQAAPTLTGDVSGVLPAAVTFGNSTGFNDYFHPVQYGNSFQFVLTLDGAAINAPNNGPAGTTFGIALYDNADPLSALLTDTPDFLATADINPDGTVTITRFNLPRGGPPAATFTLNDVPEPSTILLTGAGLLLAGCLSRRRAR